MLLSYTQMCPIPANHYHNPFSSISLIYQSQALLTPPPLASPPPPRPGLVIRISPKASPRPHPTAFLHLPCDTVCPRPKARPENASCQRAVQTPEPGLGVGGGNPAHLCSLSQPAPFCSLYSDHTQHPPSLHLDPGVLPPR